MKRVSAVVLMLMLCISMVYPVAAAEDDFVPSITYKGEPDIVYTENDQGEPVIGVVSDRETEEVVSYVGESCLMITSVAELDATDSIPEEAAQMLRFLYRELSEGDMKLPYDKVEGCNEEDMVILELLDATWFCARSDADHDHSAEVEPEGIVFRITFNLGVAADKNVVVMTYQDDEWNPIAEVKNNGDGTVTCTFEQLGPVAIAVEQSAEAVLPQTGDDANVALWVGVLGVALVGLIVLIVLSHRQMSKKNRSKK